MLDSAITFARARWGRQFPDRASLLRWQRVRVDKFLRQQLPRAGFYRQHAQKALEDLPVVDKQTMVANFSGFNTRGVTLEQALAVALEAERTRDFRPTIGDLTVGLSTGTSGTRSVFLVSPGERQRWAGLILARVLTSASLQRLAQPWRAPLRLAFFLRATSHLYETVASRRLRFTFYDLTEDFDRHLRRLNAECPDVVVAPPSVLRRLADARLDGRLEISPSQLLSVAEVIEPGERELIQLAFGQPVQEIYQATEGFLAASCPSGRLHLNEEFVHFETEWLDQERRRFRPIVTDFTRTTQLMVRFRLDDVLRVGDGACPCGRVTLSLDAVEGRCDDVLWQPSTDGTLRPIFPDVVRQAMAIADAAIYDYRIEQHLTTWHLRIRTVAADAAATERSVRFGIEELCRRLATEQPMLRFDPWIDPSPIEKRRRIRCVVAPAAIGAAS
jgi:putative adenylate-forming enzyme